MNKRDIVELLNTFFLKSFTPWSPLWMRRARPPPRSQSTRWPTLCPRPRLASCGPQRRCWKFWGRCNHDSPWIQSRWLYRVTHLLAEKVNMTLVPSQRTSVWVGTDVNITFSASRWVTLYTLESSCLTRKERKTAKCTSIVELLNNSLFLGGIRCTAPDCQGVSLNCLLRSSSSSPSFSEWKSNIKRPPSFLDD